MVSVITTWLKTYSLSFARKPLINSQIINLVSLKDKASFPSPIFIKMSESVNSDEKVFLI